MQESGEMMLASEKIGALNAKVLEE